MLSPLSLARVFIYFFGSSVVTGAGIYGGYCPVMAGCVRQLFAVDGLMKSRFPCTGLQEQPALGTVYR